MPLPNFLVLGAAKAGTTSLHEYLRQHPEIYLPGWKELRFFAYDGHPPDHQGPGDATSNRQTATTLEGYCSHFEAVTQEKAIGEVSPLYLYNEWAPERIHHYVPDAKLIVILRDPAERAYSQFLHLVRESREPLLDFSQALAEEDRRVQANWEWSWHYRRVGLYSHQLKRYCERFSRDQIRVYLYEDFQNEPQSLLKDLFRFLAVDECFVPDMSRRYNVSGIPRSAVAMKILALRRGARAFLRPLGPVLPAGLSKAGLAGLQKLYDRDSVRPRLSPELRKALIASYRDDILRLETLIDRDLSQWLA
jgi:hypothetical protein